MISRLISHHPAHIPNRYIHTHHLHTGHATPTSTHAHSLAFPSSRYATIPKRKWTVSSIGFGSYRVREGVEEHREALTAAMRSGVNFVDCSSHFGGGSSERLIGQVLDGLFRTGEVKRESVVITTKAGYTPIPSTPSFDYIRVNDKIAHSLDPTFLKSELEASLQRLGLETVDIFMLNNPERMVSGVDKRLTMDQVYTRFAEACVYLDSEVKNGRIQSYGICSHSAANPHAIDYFNVPQVIQTATSLGANIKDNMVAVQFPFNIFERDAFGGEGLMRTLKKHDLFPITHRPINSIANGKVRMLSTNMGVNVQDELAISESLTRSFEALAELEGRMAETVGQDAEDNTLLSKFVWAQVLADNISRLAPDLFAARHFLQSQVVPALDADIAALQKRAREVGDAGMEVWAGEYQKHAHDVISRTLEISTITATNSNIDLANNLARVSTSLQSAQPTTSSSSSSSSSSSTSTTTTTAFSAASSNLIFPPSSDTTPLPLSVMAVKLAASVLDVVARTDSNTDTNTNNTTTTTDTHTTSGGCVLVGMRRPEYVREMVDGVLNGDRVSEEDIERVFGSWCLRG